MRQVLQFLTDVFFAPNRQIGGVSAAEMTLHDALRLCAAARACQIGDANESSWIPERKVEVCRYRSNSELFGQWRRWDRSQPSAKLTVILALGSFLHGNLRDLVRRQRLTHRLILVPQAGHWPGTDSFGDLALASHSLGWNSIEMRRDLGEVVGMEMTAMEEDDLLVVMLPLDQGGVRSGRCTSSVIEVGARHHWK